MLDPLHETHQGIKDALSAPRTVVMAVANVAFLGIGLMANRFIGDYVERNVPIDDVALEAIINEESQL